MPRFRFHHLVVEARSTLPADPVALLLAPLPQAPMETPADLLLETRAGAGPADLAPRLGGPPAFTLDDVKVRVAAGLVEITWPVARFTVDAGPLPHAVGVLDATALADPTTLHLAAQRPALLAFAAAARTRGVFHLQAACLVLAGDRTVLVPGLVGAGKSSLAAALIAAGAGYLGDDTVWLARRPEGIRLLALPRPFHLTEPSAAAVGLAARLEPGDRTRSGRRRLDPAAAFPGAFHWEAAAPSAILLPSLTGETVTRLEPAEPADAMGALLEGSALAASRGLPGGATHLPLLGELCDGAAVYRAELGLDLLADGAAVARQLVQRLADA